jgi:CubicO group peptidase (beta-lactamase class C family)
MVAAAGPSALGFDPDRLQRLDAYMASVVARGQVAGMSTLLVRHGQVVAFRTYGAADIAGGKPVSRDTIFRLYSMSKPLTGVAMMVLFEEGKWRLDDPVERFVPQFKGLRVMTSVGPDGKIATEPMKRSPTMRDLMSHQAGFGYGLLDQNPVDRAYQEKKVLRSAGLQQMVDRVAEVPLEYQPGSSWSYSIAVDIQGYIVEKLSGQMLGDFMKERIFTPLRMNDTGFYVRPGQEGRLASLYELDPATKRLRLARSMGDLPFDFTKPPAMESGGGGLVSTTTDYARFCQMMLNKGELDGVRILSPASVELMETNVLSEATLQKDVERAELGGASFSPARGFGLDVMVEIDPRRAGSMAGKNTISWRGAAGTWFWIDPTNDLAFVGMIQRAWGVPDEDLVDRARVLTYQALVHPEM